MTIRELVGASGRRGIALAGVVLTLSAGTAAGVAVTGVEARRDTTDATDAVRTAAVRGAVGGTVQRYADTIHDLVTVVADRPAGDLSPTVARLVGDRLPGAHQVLVVDPGNVVIGRHTVDATSPAPQPVLRPDPPLVRAMQLARSTGRLVAGGPHVPAADDGLPAAQHRPGFDLVAAVQTGTDFRGWVLVSVRAGDLLAAALLAADVTGVDATLTTTAPDGTRVVVAHWPPAEDPPNGDPPNGDPAHAYPSGGGATLSLPLAGQDWQVVVRPVTSSRAGPPLANILAPLAVVLIGLISAGLVLVLSADRRRARRIAVLRQADAARARDAERLLRERETELVGFTAMAGDGLHAPLTTIAGFTELLEEEAGPGLDAASRGFLDRVRTSTQRMLSLVAELRAYTAATEAALRLETVDLAAVTAEVVAGHLAASTGERPSIDVGTLPLVTADAELLGQVVDQLIGNALRFVRHGSTARITIGARREPDGWWRIEVADRGIGVADEHRRRIFAPFHRAPAAEGFPGSGLGLAICRRIVDLHGGELDLRPHPGGGSVFSFTVAGAEVTRRAGGQPSVGATHP